MEDRRREGGRREGEVWGEEGEGEGERAILGVRGEEEEERGEGEARGEARGEAWGEGRGEEEEGREGAGVMGAELLESKSSLFLVEEEEGEGGVSM